MIRGIGATLLLACAAHAQTGDMTQLERDAETALAEVSRLEAQFQTVPELFSAADREDRATWGSIYHLNREFERASLSLFGAIEPRGSEDPEAVKATVSYGDSLYLLADSLYQLGNLGAAQRYFEQLLSSPSLGYAADAIERLMELAAREGNYARIDDYFDRYLKTSGGAAPGKVRYLRARSLFFAKNDAGAVEQLDLIPAGDPFDLRARYLRAAIATRRGDLAAALTVFDSIVGASPVAREDTAVRELALLGRGRALYELDRLDESIEAYQSIDYDSPYLTSMLYEVTLAFVRRGQLALRGTKDDGLSELQRRDRAQLEYERALRQLDDLRSLEPDGPRSADIDLLAGSLRLQRAQFADADKLFRSVVDRYRSVDSALVALMADTSMADRVLEDILALEKDPRAALRSPLPMAAAQRAARSHDVAESVQVFKALQESRADVSASREMLAALDEELSPDNPSRAELFKPLRNGVERSISVANAVLALRARAAAASRSLASPTGETRAGLEDVASRRKALEAQIANLPKTPEEFAARRQRMKERAESIEGSIHELTLVTSQLRAAASSVQWLAGEQTAPQARSAAEKSREQAQDVAREISAEAEKLSQLRAQLAQVKRSIRTAGGRGSAEERLRTSLAAIFAEEQELLAKATPAQNAAPAARVAAVIKVIDDVAQRNTSFRERLDAGVSERLAGAREMLAAEQRSLDAYEQALLALDARAAGLRGGATSVALERVRKELRNVVVRADVGLVDSAFSRKQAETEKITALQRARAAELTDLTQAYADLTKDELP